MIDFSISLSGIRAATTRQSVRSNNIANATTPAFKPGRTNQVDVSPGGTRIDGIQVLFQQGPLELSEGRFHLAIQGDGFFGVNTPEGMRYTRAGAFQIDGQGRVVTSAGHPLVPEIQVPSDAASVNITPGGDVSAIMPDGTVQSLGQISLTRFANPGGLMAEGGNLYSVGAAAGTPVSGVPGTDSLGNIVFGALEGSGVDLSSELVGMVVDRALFGANIAAIRAKDDMLGELLDLRG